MHYERYLRGQLVSLEFHVEAKKHIEAQVNDIIKGSNKWADKIVAIRTDYSVPLEWIAHLLPVSVPKYPFIYVIRDNLVKWPDRELPFLKIFRLYADSLEIIKYKHYSRQQFDSYSLRNFR